MEEYENPQPAVMATKTALDNARKARNDTQGRAAVPRVQIFQLYMNLLADEVASHGTS